MLDACKGTAAWTFTDISQYILGIQPDYDGLALDPCVPADFGGYTLTRKYRGAQYHIEITNPDHVQKGIRSLIVDGEEISGNVIPYVEGKTEYHVKAIMG